MKNILVLAGGRDSDPANAPKSFSAALPNLFSNRLRFWVFLMH
jgi:hypothetical protein